MNAIEIRNLSKRFGKTIALKDVSLTVEAGKIYGLLGRNGAGKTTLLNILTNRMFSDSGDTLVDGESAPENESAQSKMYCMTERNFHPAQMKVREGFKWAKNFYPTFDLEYAQDLSSRFNLDTGKRINRLSSGYNSVFKLILTLASRVPVMIFDEPVLGLDAAHRELFYRLLLEYYGKWGGTIIISTHLIDEVAEILEEIIILKEGELILSQSVESVMQSAYSVSGNIEAVDTYSEGRNIIASETIGRLKIATVFGQRTTDDKEKIGELDLDTMPARLQEVFISLTN